MNLTFCQPFQCRCCFLLGSHPLVTQLAPIPHHALMRDVHVSVKKQIALMRSEKRGLAQAELVNHGAHLRSLSGSIRLAQLVQFRDGGRVAPLVLTNTSRGQALEDGSRDGLGYLGEHFAGMLVERTIDAASPLI